MTENSEERMADVETEALIGRIVDCEATPADCRQFERLAGADTGLWNTLARHQLDLAMLTDRVGARIEAADRVDVLPRRRVGRLSLILVLSGWAAALVMVIWWVAVVGPTAPPHVEPVAATPPAAALTPGDHLRKFLEAEYVLGELDPILLEVEPLPDGRTRLRFVRRIEEYVEIRTPVEAVIDDGKLTVDPSKLRSD